MPKQPALLLMKFSEPSLWKRPETTRSPEAMMDPVRMKTPANAAVGPAVGANCRGGVMADAMGRLKIGADGRLEAPGRERMRGHTRWHNDVPRFGALVRR